MNDPVCGKKIEITPETPKTDCQGQTLHFCSRACLEKYVCNPEKKLTDYLFDAVIIGGGPAGLSAGIYAGLSGLETLFLAKSIGGQAWDSTDVRNYPGFEMITGPDLVQKLKSQLFGSLHLNHQFCYVTEIQKQGDYFSVCTEDGDAYLTRTVLLATGMKRRRMGITGEEKFLGKGVASFHAMNAQKFKDMRVVVVGGGNSAVQAALGLHGAGATRVVLSTRGYQPDQYLKDRVEQTSIEVLVDRSPGRVEGQERVEAFVVTDKTGAEERYECDAIFVEIGLVPNADLVKHLALLNERGEVQVDTNCRTGLPGLFAAGDVANTFGKRILIASGEGAKAILSIEEYLSRLAKN